MADIKIFVSHRIDINSELIDNPLYVPVRCGAVFDRENQMNIAGDDTGDNISEKRMSFCEFTVQYWAWKNVEADYYGLCHYRRYLSFAEKRFPKTQGGLVPEKYIGESTIHKYGLNTQEKMAGLIEAYDVVTSEPVRVDHITTPKGFQKTAGELWQANCGVFIEKDTLAQLRELIHRFSPEYDRAAAEYLAGNEHRGYNCYVMKRELFRRLCEFQFPILFELERRRKGTDTLLKEPGYAGEILYGIFLYQITKLEAWRVKELQLIFFRETRRLNAAGRAARQVKSCAEQAVRRLIDPLFPLGSKRRETCKKIYNRLRGR